MSCSVRIKVRFYWWKVWTNKTEAFFARWWNVMLRPSPGQVLLVEGLVQQDRGFRCTQVKCHAPSEPRSGFIGGRFGPTRQRLLLHAGKMSCSIRAQVGFIGGRFGPIRQRLSLHAGKMSCSVRIKVKFYWWKFGPDWEQGRTLRLIFWKNLSPSLSTEVRFIVEGLNQ